MKRTGQVIADRYRFLKLLGRGGQSEIYEALDLVDGDRVAVKVLADPIARDPAWRERMFREAQVMARLRSKAAVRVLATVWADDGALCLVMELLRGLDFDKFLMAREEKGVRMDGEELVALLDPIVQTLEEAHGVGIVHRDIKPANIFIQNPEAGGGTARLLDFGFAKFTRSRALTAQGMIAGSPSYIAPEAWLGDQRLDHRIDVYSMGAVVFRGLAGKPPFQARDLVGLLQMVTTAARPSLHALRSDLPVEIDDWVALVLAANREERFQSMRASWNALRGALGLKRGAELRGVRR